MSRFTQFTPGTPLEIRQIHNKAEAREGQVYYGKAADGSVHKYIGTHEGRLELQDELIATKEDVANNETTIIDVDLAKADKCLAIAYAIVL